MGFLTFRQMEKLRVIRVDLAKLSFEHVADFIIIGSNTRAEYGGYIVWRRA